MSREYPPMLGGNDTQNIIAIRDYLVRLVQSLDEITTSSNVVVTNGNATTQLAATLKNMIGNLATKEAADFNSLDDDIGALETRLDNDETTITSHTGSITTLNSFRAASQNNLSLSDTANGGVSFGQGSTPTSSTVSLPDTWQLKIGDTTLNETQLIALLALL